MHTRTKALAIASATLLMSLINNHAPVSVFVSETGRYVVTMDEWGHLGKLPVVIYGARGRLVKVHDIDSLGLDDDVGHIQTTMSNYLWNEHSVSFFGPKEETFVIRLHWGSGEGTGVDCAGVSQASQDKET